MRVVVIANDQQWEEWPAKNTAVEWVHADNINDVAMHAADLYINLIDSPVRTLAEMNAPKNMIRIIAWPGFLERDAWEVAGEISESVSAMFRALGKKLIPVADEPGLVAARVISMIINEAYYALGDAVSTKHEIDTAMKLGTNYPFGPFEWAEKIGLKNVYELLNELNKNDGRYKPAPALESEMNKK